MTVSDATKKSEVLNFFKSIIWFVVIVLFIRGTLIEAFKIPSGSMIPTLKIGDHLLVSKLSYGLRLPFVNSALFQWAVPNRQSIVVFTRPDEPYSPENEAGINIIKRVIGLPGETVQVRGTQVFINGEKLDEPYAIWERNGAMEGNFGPTVVPANHILLLGDNRDASKDSRFWEDPFLPLELVKGKALFIYWSFDDLSRFGKIIR